MEQYVDKVVEYAQNDGLIIEDFILLGVTYEGKRFLFSLKDRNIVADKYKNDECLGGYGLYLKWRLE